MNYLLKLLRQGRPWLFVKEDLGLMKNLPKFKPFPAQPFAVLVENDWNLWSDHGRLLFFAIFGHAT